MTIQHFSSPRAALQEAIPEIEITTPHETNQKQTGSKPRPSAGPICKATFCNILKRSFHGKYVFVSYLIPQNAFHRRRPPLLQFEKHFEKNINMRRAPCLSHKMTILHFTNITSRSTTIAESIGKQSQNSSTRTKHHVAQTRSNTSWCEMRWCAMWWCWCVVV